LEERETAVVVIVEVAIGVMEVGRLREADGVPQKATATMVTRRRGVLIGRAGVNILGGTTSTDTGC
jgi:hypothetical protein